jgi:hypothetical protein
MIDKTIAMDLVGGGVVTLVVAKVVAWRVLPADRFSGLPEHTTVFLQGDISFKLLGDVGDVFVELLERA